MASRKQDKHINVALFVPHEGCPNDCMFCNQKAISGKTERLTAADVALAAETAIGSGKDTTGGEIAFFGGSFTAIDKDYRKELLDAAKPYIENGSFKGIRISTRPDFIDDEILMLLKEYGVTAIELGAQSMVDKVLKANCRGHLSEDTRRASELIKSYGFELGLQMMTGMYADTDEGTLYTADEFIKLRPATVRIYPTIVLKNTMLAELYYKKLYEPQTLGEAIEICAQLLLKFNAANIKVIRLGLHSGGGVEPDYIAGPYYPAFGELCESRVYFKKATDMLKDYPKGKYQLIVNKSEISKMIGQRRENLIKLAEMGYECRVLGSEDIIPYEIKISR